MPSLETKRPVRVYLLALFVLTVAAWNGLRLGEVIFFWKTLAEYGASPLYISISGGFWLIAGLFLLWGLWQGKVWGWLAALLGTAGYTAWYWFDRLFMQKPHANGSFVLVTQAIIIFIIYMLLLSPRTRRFFQKRVLSQ